MHQDLVIIVLAFIEGFALILSPCILPIIPLMLAGAMAGNRKRILSMMLGFVITFATVAAFAKFIVNGLHIDLNLLRQGAYILLFLLGLILLSSHLSLWFSRLTQGIAEFGQQSKSKVSPFSILSGLMWGGLLALVWTPCAGPILAAVLVQISIQNTTFLSFCTLISFSLGVALPLGMIAYLGVALQSSISFLKRHSEAVRRLLGIIIWASLFYMIEVDYYLANQEVSKTSIRNSTSLLNGLWKPYPAPSLAGISQYFNTKPFQLSDLKGKVVLIDFWTYSCINCIRTLPYLKGWYKKYHDKGFEIVGVHTPEFDFEKDPNNVKKAVQEYGLTYPIVLDNDSLTWLNFENHYWPAHYLIDKNGQVVYLHFGEGDYDITENNIRYLLNIKELVPLQIPSFNSKFLAISPEIYFGYERADSQYSPNLVPDQTVVYEDSKSLSQNSWSLNGKWQVNAHQIIAKEKGATLSLNFYAKNVYLVLGNPTQKPLIIEIELNGKLVKNISIEKYTLYPIINLEKVQNGLITIKCKDSGIEFYTATFGN